MDILKEMCENDFDLDIFSCVFSSGTIQPTIEQRRAMLQVLENKKSILTFEMGLGKTSIMLGFATLLLPRAIKENKLIIISVPSANIGSFKELVNTQMYFTNRIMIIDGQKKNVDKFVKALDNNEVNLLICQHSCWVSSPNFNFCIFNRRDRVLATLYDEAVEKTSKGYQHFIALSELQSEYVVMATASFSGSVSSFKENNTDVLLPVYNLYKAISLLPPNMTYNNFLQRYTFTEFKRNNAIYKPKTLELQNLAKDKIINMSRHQINLDTEFEQINFVRVNPTPDMDKNIQKTSDSFRRILYGEVDYIPYTIPTVPSLGALVQLIPTLDSNTNKLIYCNHRESTEKMRTLLQLLGYKVHVINGVVTPKSDDKKKVCDIFNSESGSIVITNIIKGINLGSVKDIITLSIPNDLPQFIARATRGFIKGKVKLHIIYYPRYEKSTIKACYDMIKMTDTALDREYGKLLEALKKEVAQW